MSCALTTGRTNPCNDNVGGVKRVYLFKYEDYANTSILGLKGSTLTSFPATDIYSYECVNANFNEDIINDENGISVDQTLTFTLRKQNLLTTQRIEPITNIDVRYIVEFNNGKFRIGGLFKGANIQELKLVSGGRKEDLNGYQITIKSTEEYQAAFIDNLSSAGFTVIYWLLLEDFTELLLENNDQLILE